MSEETKDVSIYDFALKMELDGKSFYARQAETTDNPGLRTIFSRLAEDEQKHYDAILRLKNRSGTLNMATSTVLEDTKNVFQQLSESGKSPESLSDDLEGYRYAMKVEAESFRLYEDAAGKENDEAVRQVLLRIAEEEHEHFNILEHVYHFVNAPNQFLAWGEFSNLDEFRNFGRDVDIMEGKDTPEIQPGISGKSPDEERNE
ncbi:MAG: ferritin-like domain-containing protein [Desulfuromonadales bacterium]